MNLFPSVLIAVAVLVAACGPGAATTSSPSSGSQQPAAPKRVTTAISGVPKFVPSSLNAGGGGRIDGNTELNGLTSAGLVVQQADGKWVPHVAEAVPTTDNGMWRVLADGRMETTYRIRDNAFWHDGQPIRADDYVFTSRLDQDKDMPWLVDRVYQYIDNVEAVDPRTVKVSWKQPYIRADQAAFTPLYPKHILEETYLRGDKQNISNIPFWTTEFIGTGPFRVKDFVQDSHVILTAFDRFFLGRPRIDELEVKFIADANTLRANLLAGTVWVTLGPGLSAEQGIQIRDLWQEGVMQAGPSGNISMNPQFLNPDPAILLNAQFRKALYMAIDRQQLVDELVYGLSKPLDAQIAPTEPEWPFVEPHIVKYQFDPRRSAEMIDALGYRKGADGMYVDSAGRPLSIQIMATQDDSNAKPQAAILDMWKRIGITPDLEAVTQQNQRDLAYRANFRSFSLQSGVGFGPDGANALLSREARTAEKNYIGGNYIRWMNPETDALVEKYFTTIPFNERMQVLAQIHRFATDNLLWFPLYLRVLPTMNNKKFTGITPVGQGNQWWNAHTWDIS